MIYGFRWRMVTHGGIDGNTRIPVYLKCSDNNHAEIVLKHFEGAIQEYGLPSRVRSDRGGGTPLFPPVYVTAVGKPALSVWSCNTVRAPEAQGKCYLGGSGGILPWQILRFRLSETPFASISA